MVNFVALIHKDADSEFGVSFPDFPGVVTAAASLEAAALAAEEALSLHIKGMIEDGEPLPNPTPLDVIKADPANADHIPIAVLSVLAFHDRFSKRYPTMMAKLQSQEATDWGKPEGDEAW